MPTKAEQEAQKVLDKAEREIARIDKMKASVDKYTFQKSGKHVQLLSSGDARELISNLKGLAEEAVNKNRKV